MATGRVKWFNNAKGYGFILPDNSEGDLFVHYSSIQIDGYRTLKAGQAVTFDIIDGDKGSHAVNIVPETEETKTSRDTVAEKPEATTGNHAETA